MFVDAGIGIYTPRRYGSLWSGNSTYCAIPITCHECLPLVNVLHLIGIKRPHLCAILVFPCRTRGKSVRMAGSSTGIFLLHFFLVGGGGGTEAAEVQIMAVSVCPSGTPISIGSRAFQYRATASVGTWYIKGRNSPSLCSCWGVAIPVKYFELHKDFSYMSKSRDRGMEWVYLYSVEGGFQSFPVWPREHQNGT